ncbi:50S ribosomal protein L6 [Bifidobacterium biavatii]|uniref:50S ribosomal protein L6 n=1 Tax=Bifidobacterium biavatii DSM 23969 TaxID=1437608 RepID=A0A086ZMS0_9BIFI|nr:50S ribosomal protein L6 [Bifidobacterium biavatii]KFI47820.1 50S ribosomal protein L6 [Bifidobacterium biavatii DSM 23969]
MASHIGKLPVAIPAGVEVTIDGQTVAAKGPKAPTPSSCRRASPPSSRTTRLFSPRPMTCVRPARSTGLSRALVASIVKGVHEGYAKTLQIVGTGYRATLKGKSIEFALGYSHTITVNPPEGIEFEVPNANTVIVKGTDKQAVGQAAANIRKLRAPEPYKGKGIKYADEHILRKAGKAGK